MDCFPAAEDTPGEPAKGQLPTLFASAGRRSLQVIRSWVAAVVFTLGPAYL